VKLDEPVTGPETDEDVLLLPPYGALYEPLAVLLVYGGRPPVPVGPTTGALEVELMVYGGRPPVPVGPTTGALEVELP